MITLRQMAYQFLDDVSGGGLTSDTRFDEREIVLKIRQLMNEVMPMKFYEKWNEGDRSAIAIYLSSYPLILENDADNDRCFVIMPEFCQGQPYNRGIHRMFLKKDQYKDIVLDPNPGVTSNLPAGKLYGKKYAYQEGYKLVIRNMTLEPDITDEEKTIIIQLLIAAPDTIGLSDPLPILPEHQNEILKRLRALYLPTPQDLTPNGSKDI